MDLLKIPLTEITERGLCVDANVAMATIQPPGAEDLPASGVHVYGTFTPVGGDYLFQGQLKGSFTGSCDRCLVEADLPFDLEVLWDYREGPPAPGSDTVPPEDDDALEEAEAGQAGGCRTYQGTVIDLGPSVWEELVLSVPVKLVCSPECQGLCAQCGANLNQGSCSCGAAENEETNDGQGFAGLAEMFPDLTDKKPEE